jgi:Lar family restriction alleviation protein
LRQKANGLLTEAKRTRPENNEEVTMEKLKPCPFCGFEDIEVDRGEFSSHATCIKCEAQGPLEESVAKAIEAWNKAYRPDPPPDDWRPEEAQ